MSPGGKAAEFRYLPSGKSGRAPSVSLARTAGQPRERLARSVTASTVYSGCRRPRFCPEVRVAGWILALACREDERRIGDGLRFFSPLLAHLKGVSVTSRISAPRCPERSPTGGANVPVSLLGPNEGGRPADTLAPPEVTCPSLSTAAAVRTLRSEVRLVGSTAGEFGNCVSPHRAPGANPPRPRNETVPRIVAPAEQDDHDHVRQGLRSPLEKVMGCARTAAFRESSARAQPAAQQC